MLIADLNLGQSIVAGVVVAAISAVVTWVLQRQSERNAEAARKREQERADREKQAEWERANREKRAREAREARAAAREVDGELAHMEGPLEEVEREAAKARSTFAESGSTDHLTYMELHAAMVAADEALTDGEWKTRRDTLNRYVRSDEWELLAAPYALLRSWKRRDPEPIGEGSDEGAVTLEMSRLLLESVHADAILDAVGEARQACKRIEEGAQDAH